MIKIRGLKKAFGDNMVLDGIDTDIEKGEVVSIIGPSGTGKSTFLRCINLLEKPESGTISFDDFSIDFSHYSKQEEHELRLHSNMVFQQFNLFQKKTALQNVMEGLVIVKGLSKDEAERIAKEELAKVKLTDRLNYYPRHLSGGQQQRVAIARAMAMNPELMLFDEPTSALDPELVGEVLDTIQTVANEGNTMIIVSHEMQFVRDVSDKVIFMENGKIIEQGTPEEIFDAPVNERTREFLVKNHVNVPPEYAI